MHFVGEKMTQLNIQPDKVIFSPASGEKVGQQPQVWLKLQRGGAPEWAVEQATERFRFSQRPTPGAMGGTDIPVAQWCVYIDTVEWQKQFNHSDEIRLKAENALLMNPDYIQVDEPVLRAPWPRYDELVAKGTRTDGKVAESNLLTAEQIGVPIEALIVYEEARFGRLVVLAAYHEALFDSEDPTEVVLGVTA
jgi:hypothetical protein